MVWEIISLGRKISLVHWVKTLLLHLPDENIFQSGSEMQSN